MHEVAINYFTFLLSEAKKIGQMKESDRKHMALDSAKRFTVTLHDLPIVRRVTLTKRPNLTVCIADDILFMITVLERESLLSP